MQASIVPHCRSGNAQFHGTVPPTTQGLWDDPMPAGYRCSASQTVPHPTPTTERTSCRTLFGSTHQTPKLQFPGSRIGRFSRCISAFLESLQSGRRELACAVMQPYLERSSGGHDTCDAPHQGAENSAPSSERQLPRNFGRCIASSKTSLYQSG
jgi:hypothetical protein